MNPIDLRSQIEEEITWRLDEIRLLRNMLGYLDKEEDRNRYRKSLVTMLYAHFEGFCKTSFLSFIQYINAEAIPRSEINSRLLASSMAGEFKDYHGTRKSELFGRSLPDDPKIHQYARQVCLVERFNDFLLTVTFIPDDVVDTESNLTPVVLRKILYRLGFNYDAFVSNEGEIHKLLNHRNEIAHGVRSHGLSETQYNKIEEATVNLMNELVEMIFNFAIGKCYLKTDAS